MAIRIVAEIIPKIDLILNMKNKHKMISAMIIY